MDVCEAADRHGMISNYDGPLGCSSPFASVWNARSDLACDSLRQMSGFACLSGIFVGHQEASTNFSRSARSAPMLTGLRVDVNPGCGGRDAVGLTAEVGRDRLQLRCSPHAAALSGEVSSARRPGEDVEVSNEVYVCRARSVLSSERMSKGTQSSAGEAQSQ